MPTWSPSQYLQFGSERARPALDLLARIPLDSPRFVYDLGCGPGSVTALLEKRWPEARIEGVDSSEAMLARARELSTKVSWRQAKLELWQPQEPADVIFSNAALHWVDEHESLFPRLVSALAPGGHLAVQMPANFDQPTHRAIVETVREGPWAERLEGHLREWPVLEPARYHQLLHGLVRHLDIWETTYLHALEGEDPVVEWVKGSALRPVLDQLHEMERETFLDAYRRRVRAAYPAEKDGRTLLPFRRLFLVAARASVAA